MRNLSVFGIFCLLSLSSYAADKAPSPRVAGSKAANMTVEQRESMAKAHEQMAVCLRSDKDMTVCHDELMTSCRGTDACPMMGMDRRGPGAKGKGNH